MSRITLALPFFRKGHTPMSFKVGDYVVNDNYPTMYCVVEHVRTDGAYARNLNPDDMFRPHNPLEPRFWRKATPEDVAKWIARRMTAA